MRFHLSKLIVCAGVCVVLFAQNRMTYPIVAQDSGHVALGLALRKLNVSGTFMQAPAHPDDETNGLFALFGYGMGLRTIDVQNNRGEGGQNEIGPELFHDIGVLRTSELLSAHRIDGAEQYFTRAIDYGYSFDPEEVIGKWGRKEIVGDYVRFFRTFRPDIVVTMNIQGRGGDRAHEATTVLVREAYRAAGDPTMYPEQIREGLRPWQPRKLYFSAGFGGPGGGRGGPAGTAAPAQAPPTPPVKLTPVNTAGYDALLGRTYAEIGTDARSNHKCQGMGGLGPLPGVAPGGRGAAGDGGGRGGRGARGAAAPPAAGGTPAAPPGGGRGGFGPGGYQLMETTIAGQKEKDEKTLFDDIDVSLAGVAQYAGGNPPEALTRGLAAVIEQAKRAQAAFAAGDDNGTAAPVEAGLAALRSLRTNLASMGLSDAARYEIDFRLRNKERDYEDAVLAAHGLVFDAQADDGLVVAGQPIRLSFSAVHRGAGEVGITAVDIAGFDSPGKCDPSVLKKDATFTCAPEAHIPADAKLTTPYFHDEYWKHPENPARNIFDPGVPFGVPFAPTPFHATFHVRAGQVEVTRVVPVQFRYVKDIFYGDKRMELNVVPAFSVRVTPALAVVPAGSGAAEREIHVSVTSGLKEAAKAAVALELPAGWKAEPASAPLDFTHEDESLTARFLITGPAGVKAGEYTVRAVVTSAAAAGRKFDNGYQEIDYPHIQRRQVIKPAEAALKVIDVKPAPHISVGFIVGAGDQVPEAIEQLGAKVSYIEPNELAWGDLSKYDMIMTGVRAYERRADLRAYNHRLLDYVEHGGTVIVEYNKMEFNREEYGPFPAKVSGNRVTDETAPVKVLDPSHPLFNYPNKIGPSAWSGWVQERGLYFLGEKDAKYKDLVAMTDPFKDNPGEKLGALVEGRYGRGRWLYVGLGLWRQLPAGTDGAYQLLANLLALPKEPTSH
jgi:LmbE family N-acetylglucosaminyl deacetylase